MFTMVDFKSYSLKNILNSHQLIKDVIHVNGCLFCSSSENVLLYYMYSSHGWFQPIHYCCACIWLGAILLWAGRQGKRSLHWEMTPLFDVRLEFIRLDESLRSGVRVFFFVGGPHLSPRQCVDFYCRGYVRRHHPGAAYFYSPTSGDFQLCTWQSKLHNIHA